MEPNKESSWDNLINFLLFLIFLYTYNIQKIEEMESDGCSRAKIATELNIPARALWEYIPRKNPE